VMGVRRFGGGRREHRGAEAGEKSFEELHRRAGQLTAQCSGNSAVRRLGKASIYLGTFRSTRRKFSVGTAFYDALQCEFWCTAALFHIIKNESVI
ncbi:hypothetical protein, partial [Cupriavidus plantarum]|uniref:hypothetical protein n=1 Tax=Cupriavidus plantarum TaxID=942865 RepID=UPI00339D4CF4